MNRKRALCVTFLLCLIPAVVAAGDVSPHRAHIHVVGTDNAPYPVAEIGCAWSDDPAPTDYGSAWLCTDCYEALCTFTGDMTDFQGAYIVTGWGTGKPYAEISWDPPSIYYGQLLVGDDWHLFGMWATNAGAPGNDWEAIHEITYTIQAISGIPTPVPTPTPIATLTPPEPASIEMLSEGFGAGFEQTYGTLTASGAFPNFGIDHTQWLFYARKWVQFINSGNLLWVICAISLAGLVLGWAIDKIRNPR